MNDDKPLLVFFTSERSGPARRMESLLAHLARKERTRVRVMRVDVEAQPELATSRPPRPPKSAPGRSP